jgi:histidinol dehydrogenase
MIKSLNSNSKKFNQELNKFLNLRIKNINLRNSKVFKIVDDVKKNGDKALIKYEKKIQCKF